MSIRNTVKRLLPDSVMEQLQLAKFRLLDPFAVSSYAQEGEDIILRRIFHDTKVGFYVDVGAHHPMRFSNTYMFYKMGWSGINIDAMPGSKKLFDQLRTRDINLELAIANKEEDLRYFIFNETALNSFDEKLARSRESESSRIVKTEIIHTQPLRKVLAQYLPNNQQIDFLSIDVEGYDDEVLKSNDWQIFKPKCVVVECFDVDVADLQTTDTYRFMKDLHYEAVAKTANTVVFALDSAK